MLRTLRMAAIAAAATLTAAPAMAQVNLVAHAAGAGTAGGLPQRVWLNLPPKQASPTFS